MKDLVVQDELVMTASAFSAHFKKCRRSKASRKYDRVYFVGDDNIICDYLMTAANNCNHKFGVYKTIEYVLLNGESEYRKNTLANGGISTISFKDFSGLRNNKNLIFLFIDTLDLKNRGKTVEAFKSIQKTVAATKGTKCVLALLLPGIKQYSDNAAGFSESEVNSYFENCPDKTPETEYFLEIKAL
ncbi:MAG: hypothetical protein J6T73_02570, partial [Clostridia bacterium]|nr:hypothetical protein [Clostridia bacterium]